MRFSHTSVQENTAVRIARLMRSGSDEGLGDVGIDGDEMTDEIMLSNVKCNGRIGKRYGSHDHVAYDSGEATRAAALIDMLGDVIMIRRDGDDVVADVMRMRIVMVGGGTVGRHGAMMAIGGRR